MHLTRIDIVTLVREEKQYVWTKEYHYVGGDLLRDEEEEENPIFDTNYRQLKNENFLLEKSVYYEQGVN